LGDVELLKNNFLLKKLIKNTRILRFLSFFKFTFFLMQFTSKDKSLVLFVCAALVLLWFGFSLISKLFYTASFQISEVKKISETKGEWLNSQNEITLEDLKGRAILLHFWNRSCSPCIEALPAIKKLENDLGSKLTVIGVYSAKFENEKRSSVILNAILKHDINSLVINDIDLKLWNEFEVKAWPTFVLISPTGHEYERYEGIGELGEVTKDVRNMVSKYRYEINRAPLPILPEKFSQIGNVLSFPSKLEYASDLKQGSHKISALFVANSGQNSIVVSSLAGGILFKIGSGREGFADGNFSEAQFRAPQGTLFSKQKLYVVDTGNHALRVIDFETKQVSTLIGNGEKGGIISGEIDADEIGLASPTDLEFFPNRNKIIISNSGTHQILSYDLESGKITPLAGSGKKGSKDGKYPNNSLSQTSDMVVSRKKIYFLDALTSSLRVLDGEGDVKTLVTSGLQNPLALTTDGIRLYIADSFNNRIKKYHIANKKLTTLIGGQAGDSVGRTTHFDSPEGIIRVMNRIYIADANNNRIVVLNSSKLTSEILDVIPPLKLPKEGFLEYLPNLQKSDLISVSPNKNIALNINLNKGWKINEDGPSFINLLELIGDDEANLITSFDWYFVKKKKVTLPKLSKGEDYLLQGSIYYCEDKKNALCFVKSYEQEITADGDEKDVEVEIKLGYDQNS
jgi:thiol-disulfide isomerase/thioredoxin